MNFSGFGKQQSNTFCNFQKGTGVNGGKREPKNVIVKMPSSFDFLGFKHLKDVKTQTFFIFFLGDSNI